MLVIDHEACEPSMIYQIYHALPKEKSVIFQFANCWPRQITKSCKCRC